MGMETIVNLLSLDPRFRLGGVMMQSGSLVQAVAASTSYTLFQITAGGGSVWLVGLWVYNDYTADVRLSIGTGDFTARSPQLGPLLVGFHDIIALPPTEYTADIVVQSDGAGASPNEVELQAIVAQIK